MQKDGVEVPILRLYDIGAKCFGGNVRARIEAKDEVRLDEMKMAVIVGFVKDCTVVNGR